MKITWEKKDIVELCKTYPRGCHFTMVFRPEGATITFGCNLRVNLMTGMTRIMYDLIERDGEDLGLGYKELYLDSFMEIDEYMYAEIDILMQEPCPGCGAPIHVKR